MAAPAPSPRLGQPLPHPRLVLIDRALVRQGPIQAARTGWRKMVRIFAVSVSATSDR
jgi:hypothetical protein